jgi:hypothetical protein
MVVSAGEEVKTPNHSEGKSAIFFDMALMTSLWLIFLNITS